MDRPTRPPRPAEHRSNTLFRFLLFLFSFLQKDYHSPTNQALKRFGAWEIEWESGCLGVRNTSLPRRGDAKCGRGCRRVSAGGAAGGKMSEGFSLSAAQSEVDD